MPLNDYMGSNLPPGCTDEDIERAQDQDGDMDRGLAECGRCHRVGLLEMKVCQWCGALLDEPAGGMTDVDCP
jgi:hypothetical protein